MSAITTDDLLEALSDALAKPTVGDASTIDDLCVQKGWGREKVRRLLKQLYGKGQLECVRVYRENITGTMGSVPAYRIKPK